MAAAEDIAARVEVFQRLWDATPAPRVPNFIFRENVPWQKGICFSCGDMLAGEFFGRCWPCSSAWRQVAGVAAPKPAPTGVELFE